MKDLLREVFPPVDTELRRDLWPLMRERIESRRTVPIFDWALLAAVVAGIALVPESVLSLLYHL